MNTIIKITIIAFFSILSLSSLSQSYLTVKGVVIDQKTNQEISFASISITNHSIGVISNENGEFVFKIPTSIADESLCVSMLGYNTYSIKISDLSDKQYYTFKLEPKDYVIKELTIKSKKKHPKPAKIVQLAMDSIAVNYPDVPFSLQGYYREYQKQGSSKYLNFLEAAIVLKERGFSDSFFPYQAYLLQMRFNKDYTLDKDFQTKYSNNLNINNEENAKYMPGHIMPVLAGNELSILFAHDAIRRYNETTYSFIYKLKTDFIANHFFNLDSIIYRDDIPIYCISFQYNYNSVFEKNNFVEKSNIRGKIYVRSNTYAIERLEYVSYSLEDRGMKNYEIIVDYKIHNKKMYLNYISFSNFFKIKLSPKNYSLYDIPISKQPLQVKDIAVENNSLILTFSKKVDKLTAFKRNFKFNGYITKKENNSLSDTVLLPKYPERVKVIGNNTVQISLNDIHYLLKDDSISTNFQIANNLISSNSQISATIENNVIKCKNISLTIDGLTDEFGNKFNSLCTIDMYQFREFFVNDVFSYSYTVPKAAITVSDKFPLYLQMPKEIDHFWEQFNYPIITPLLNNHVISEN